MSFYVQNLAILFITVTMLVNTYGLKSKRCEFKENKQLCKCNHRGIEHWKKASTVMQDSCSTSVILDLSKNVISTLEIKPGPENSTYQCCVPKKLSEHVESKLAVVSSNTSAHEPEMFLVFPSLQRLNLKGNRIRNISACNFYGLGNLTFLDLSENRITSICDFSFRSLTSLKELHLQINDIKNINRNHFKGLANLQVLNISGNDISKMDKESFVDMLNLRKLILRRNAIEMETLQLVNFGRLKKLKVLDLMNNRLKKVAGFEEMSSLQELYMGDNYVRKLGGSSFRGLNRLTILCLRNNRLMSIDHIAGKGKQLRNLEILTLSHNRIRNISKTAFSSMPNLRELWLDSNLLTEIPSSLVHLTNLVKLVLSDNNILSIDLSAITYLNKLSVVVLSRNMIHDVLFDDISVSLQPDSQIQKSYNNTVRFSSVQMLCLEDNRLSTVSGSMLQAFPNLESLHLSGNPLTCGCSSAPLSRFLKTHPPQCGCDDVIIDMVDDLTQLTCKPNSKVEESPTCYNYSNSIKDLTCEHFIESCSSSEVTTNKKSIAVGSSIMLDCQHPLLSNTSNYFTYCWSYEPRAGYLAYQTTYTQQLEGEQIIQDEGTYSCLAINDMVVYSTIYEVNFDYENMTEDSTTSIPIFTISKQNRTTYVGARSRTEAVTAMPIITSNTESILLVVAMITIPILIIFIVSLLCILLSITRSQRKGYNIYSAIFKRFKGSDESIYAEIDDLPMSLLNKALNDRTASQDQQCRYSRDTDSYGYTSENDDKDGGYLLPIGESTVSIDTLGDTLNAYSSHYPAHSYLTILDDTELNHDYERCGQVPQRRALTQYYDEPPDIQPKVLRMKSLDFDLCDAMEESTTLDVRPHEAKIVTQFGTVTRKQKKQTIVLKPVMIRNVEDDLPQDCLKRTWTM
ncbi:uncharacterized protein LOC117125212 [Anneissia japonica]|uniref:uncharacterized protein LOC117125212 n=1 Tax=Anneissia japonica TaxID=1529436 RepID=UPI0014256947|nr:uncharacterized protein LOC117125212 [Anneissia japonica]